MSHHPKILDSRDCQYPTLVCSCGWSYTVDPETKSQIAHWSRYLERYPGDPTSIYNGFLLGVHAMHMAQLVTERLDGKKQSSWRIQNHNVAVDTAPDYGPPNIRGFTSYAVPVRVRQRQVFTVSLTCVIPEQDNTRRDIQAALQSGQLNLLIPQ